MFSSLYWERLEEGRKEREDYIYFRYNLNIKNCICIIILEQMNVGITLEAGKQVPLHLTIRHVVSFCAAFPSSFLKHLLLPNLQPFVKLVCLLLLGRQQF